MAKVELAGSRPPERTSTATAGLMFTLLEVLLLWQLAPLSSSRTLRWSAYVLIVLLLSFMAFRPTVMRRAFAVHGARWRALRRISRIEVADVADAAPADPAERLIFAQGVAATMARVTDIIAAEQDRAAKDAKESST